MRQSVKEQMIELGSIVGVVLFTTLPFLSTTPFNWDAGQFALGVQHFSVEMHQPHPPGYPLFIVAAKLLDIVASPTIATVLVSMLAAIVAAVMLYVLLITIWKEHKALAFIVTILFVINPLFWMYREVGLTYTIDVAAMITLAWLTYQVMIHSYDDTNNNYFYGSAVAVAVFAGFRPSLALFLAPFVLVQWIYSFRYTRNWKRLIGFTLLCGGVVLIWLIPLVWLSGGLTTYRQLSNDLFKTAAAGTSVLFGGSSAAHWAQLKLVWRSLYTGWGVLSIVLGVIALTWLVRLVQRRTRIHWPMMWLTIAWVVLPLTLYTLVHFGQVGYILIVLPVGYIALLPAINYLLSHPNARLHLLARITILSIFIIQLATFLLLSPQYSHASFIPHNRASYWLQVLSHKNDLTVKMNWRMVQEQDNKVHRKEEIIQQYQPEEVIVITTRDLEYTAGNGLPVRNDNYFRTLGAILPDYDIVEVKPARDYYMRTQQANTETHYSHVVPLNNQVKYVVMVVDHLPDGVTHSGIILKDMGGYYLGIVQQPFSIVGVDFVQPQHRYLYDE